MPNVNGKEFPYTPEGRLAAEMARQEVDSLRPLRERQEEVQIAMAMRTPSASSPKLKRKLGMTKRPTRAGTKRYGTVKG